MLKGIDISNWQAGIDLNSIANKIDFCICKATEGTDFTDAYCDGFIQDCKSNGLLWGFYHFAGYESPEDEADYFYNECMNYFGHGIPILDYEVDNYDNKEWCERFLTRLHRLSGVWAMIYISAYRVSQYNDSWIPETCGLWIAGYPYNTDYFNDDKMPYSIGKWPVCAIWQFTSSLDLNCGYRLDGDYAYMDSNAWMKYAGADESESEPAKPVESVADYIELCKEIINGKWGNGSDRIERLQAAGYDSIYAQKLINEYYDLAQEIINGKWGNGWNRKTALDGAGYDYELAQMIVDAIYADDVYEGC